MNFTVWNTVVLLLGAYSVAGEVRMDKFYPFGTANLDTTLNRNNLGAYSFVTLMHPFTFLNTTHTKLLVHSYGNIFFSNFAHIFLPVNCDSKEMGKSGPRIAPFWSPVHAKNGGHVYYRQTTDPGVISKAHNDVMQGFSDAGGLRFKSVIIVTWADVAPLRSPLCPDNKLRNSFQAILTSDGETSFVILYYNELAWTQYFLYVGQSCIPDDRSVVVAGFTAGAGHPFQHVLGNCHSDVLKLTEKSNVNEPGKWVFRVDEGIVSPSVRVYTTTTQTHVQEDTTQTHLSYGNETSVSESPIDVRNHTSSYLENGTETNEFVHSVSRQGILTSIGIYYYAILVIMCMCI